MENVEQKLKLYKTAVSQAREKVAQITGSNQNLLDRLKEEFGLESVEDAEKMLEKTQAEITKLETQITTVIRKIEESYELA